VYTNTPDLLLGAESRALDISGSLDVLATLLASLGGGDGVLLVVRNIQLDTEILNRVGERGQSTVANTLDAVLGAVDFDDTLEATAEVA